MINKTIITIVVVAVLGIFYYMANTKREAYLYHNVAFPEFQAEIDFAINTAKKNNSKNIEAGKIFGMVLPHHIPTATSLLFEYYSKLKHQDVSTFVIIGPDHIDASPFPVTATLKNFSTPYGSLFNNIEITKKLIKEKIAGNQEEPFLSEHSIASQLLFISYLFPKANIVPIIMRSDVSARDATYLGKRLSEIVDDKTVIVASVDFSHYLEKTQARTVDHVNGLILRDLNLDLANNFEADSAQSLIAFMSAMKEKKAKLLGDLKITNTDEIINNTDYTTGYIIGLWGF